MSVRVEPLNESSIEPPSRGILQTYLSLDPPTEFSNKSLEARGMTSGQARQFAIHATRDRIAVRIDRGEYMAVDPSIAIRAWALPTYYAELLLLHDALTRLEIDHAFACLTATVETDLVLERPWPVTREPPDEAARKIDRFVYNYRWEGKETIEALGESYSVPTLSRPETALLLGSTGLSREVLAAQEIVEAKPPPDGLVPAFNSFGISLGSGTTESREVDIQFPRFIQERRKRLSEELLRGGGS